MVCLIPLRFAVYYEGCLEFFIYLFKPDRLSPLLIQGKIGTNYRSE